MKELVSFPHSRCRAHTWVASRLRTTRNLTMLGLTMLLALSLRSPAAHAQSYTEQTLYSFNKAGSDGFASTASLIEVNGLLYGTTQSGGAQNDGTVFSIDPTTHAEKVIYSFTNNSDGAHPAVSLTDVNGTLYGTTLSGGTGGGGTVFSINSNGTGFQTLYGFGTSGNSDAYWPESGLVEINGLLYGTSFFGGVSGDGTVFSIDPTTHAEKVIYSFGSTTDDGNYPKGSLIAIGDTLYGTTLFGGTTGNGTVYSIDSTGTGYQILYSFGASGTRDGYWPQSGLIDVNGIFYGTTFFSGGSGNGKVFSIDPTTHAEKVIYSFGSTAGDGNGPYGGLIDVNGTLYGTTQNGGTNSEGTVFSINPNGSGYQLLYSFSAPDSSGDNNDGTGPTSSLFAANGIVYGTTPSGGTSGGGTVFSLMPSIVPPVAANDSYTAKYKTTLTVAAPGVLANDNAGGGTLTATLVSNVTHGTLTLNSNGSFTYIPSSGFVGTDSFTYQAVNAVGKSNIATATLTVQPVVPVAGNDTYALKYATPYAVHAPGVLANDSNGGGTLTATLVTNVTHGTLTLNADGSFSYTPSSGFVGTDTFTYQAVNSAGKSNTATVSLVVQAVVPVAHNDAYFPIYSHAYKVNAPGVLGNDYAGDTGSLTAKLVSTVSHGTLTLNSDGSFLYSPTFEYSGTDSFTYKDSNAIGTSNTATVTFTINPVVPIARNDTYAPKYQTAYGVSAPGVLGNDDDGGTAPMTAALVANVTHGTLTFNSNGSFTYTPAAGFVGTDTFTYKDTTPTGTGNTATVTLNVTAALPVAHNDSYTLTHNKAYAVKAPGVLGNDYAGDSGSFTAKLGTTTTHGILTFNTDGSFNYTPSTGFTGTDTFTYQAKNAIGTSNTATVTLTVQ